MSAPWFLSKAQIKENMDEIFSLVESMEDQERGKKIKSMFEDLSDRFFIAPASGRVNYHNCFIGGLADHSLRVYKNLKILADNFSYKKIPHDSLIVVGLLHDIGKLGDRLTPYYIEQESEWHQNKLGEFYLHNPDLEYMGTSQRSLWLLHDYGIELTFDEYKAILLHDGQYIDANKSYQHNEGTIGLIAHMADMLACTFEKIRWESEKN